MFIKFQTTSKEEELLKILPYFLTGSPDFFEKSGGSKFVLGRTNNWWLNPKGKETWQLQYRYGDKELKEAYEKVLAHQFGFLISKCED